MRELKDSGIEWIEEIPSHWQIIPHKYVMHKEKSICESYNGEDIISLTMNGVIVRDLTAGGKMPTTFDGYQYVEPEDLLLCLFDIDVTPRCVGIVRNYGVTSPAYSRFKVHKGYFNAYYDYLLRFIDDEKVFIHLAKNLRSSLTETDFGQIKTIVPPLPEQQAIASFLDRKCAEIDAVIEKTKATIEEYKKLKQSVITEAVTKGIRDDRLMKDSGAEWLRTIPVEWNMIRGKGLFAETNARSATGEEELLTVSQYTGVTPRSQKNVNMFEAESLEGYKICEIGDIAANTMWLWAGAIGVSEYEGVISPSYNLYRQLGENFNSRYLDYLLRITPLVQCYESMSTGIRASRLRLYPQQFLSIKFPVPPMTEQVEIVAYLDNKCTEMDTLITRKTALLEEMETYKKSVIYEYVTGKKEVK